MLVTCPECGKKISDDARFCPGCGKRDAGYYSVENEEIRLMERIVRLSEALLERREQELRQEVEKEETREREEIRRERRNKIVIILVCLAILALCVILFLGPSVFQ